MRLTRLIGVTTALFASWSIAASAGPYTFIDVPNAPLAAAGQTYAFAINDFGAVGGWYSNAATGFHGFTYSGGTFTTIDGPSANGTYVNGINNSGSASGVYRDTNGYHGFVDAGGTFTTIDHPLAPLGHTNVFGINNLGVAIGSWWDDSGLQNPFTYAAGIFTPLANAGPIGTVTYPIGISDLGAYAGRYDDSSGPHSFENIGGTFFSIVFPGMDSTVAYDINNANQVTGYYSVNIGPNTIQNGFVYDGTDFVVIADPSAGLDGHTYSYGINNYGAVTGWYNDATGLSHSYIATPVPEPVTLALFGSGLAGAIAMRRRRKTKAT